MQNANLKPLINEKDFKKSPLSAEHKQLLLDYIMPSQIPELSVLAETIDKTLDEYGSLAFQVNLCLEELITNIIKYGLSHADNHPIHLQIYRTQIHLEIFLKDDAPQFDPFTEAPLPDISLDIDNRPIGGLGIHFVKTMMDQALSFYDGTGNLTILIKTLAA